MSGSDQRQGTDASLPTSRTVDYFLEAKLHRPEVRGGWVDRRRLLDLFDQATRRPVVLVAAPAGYGKTTLATQWLAQRQGTRAAAWISLDAGDNDPGRLWTHVATALERAGCTLAPDVAGFMATNSGELIAGVLPKLVHALAGLPQELVIVLDDFHFVESAACHEQMGFLIDNLPDHAHVVVITRADPGLRLGRLRASGLLAEIRAEHLSFTTDEAEALLELEQVNLSRDGLTQLVERTEGWPAGVYLASLSMSGHPDPDEFVRRFGGNDRYVTSYLSEEVLNQHADRVRDFIVTMSVLDRFCAPLCDAVADTTGSAGILDRLERRNLFLVPLDGERRWFRFHHLFAEVARTELLRLPPEQVADLHLRAAGWFGSHGHIEDAFSHLMSAGRRGEAARLAQEHWLTYVDAGRAPTVLRWLQALGTGPGDADPAADVTAAWLAALFGDEPALASHLAALQGLGDHGPLPDGTRSVESAVALIRGTFGFGGPIDMRAAAQRAAELESDERSPYAAIAKLNLGQAAYISGELNLAREMFSDAALSEAAPVIIQVLALSGQALVEDELGRSDRSRELAERAMDLVQLRQLTAMPQASMAFTALGLAQATDGKLSDAIATLEEGLAMRRRYPAGPWGMIHHLMVMARVAVQAGEIPMAQELLDDLGALMVRFPDGMSAMRARQAEIQAALRERLAAGAPEEPLTHRELDVLLLLQSAMTVREIAAALYLSSNTVKTHIQALYRKLGAHSRTDAVSIARRDHLI